MIRAAFQTEQYRPDERAGSGAEKGVWALKCVLFSQQQFTDFDVSNYTTGVESEQKAILRALNANAT